MKIILTVCILSSLLFSQVVWEEYFTDGNMQLDWDAWFTDSTGVGDSMLVINDPTTPGGDSWAGRISNEYMGMAGLTYSGEATMQHYSLEAYIYTVVSSVSGPYNGICVRMNQAANAFYSLVSDFDNSARLRLRVLVNAVPTVIRDWSSGEIPGGVPSTSSWHKLKLEVSHDSIWAYYDDVLLPDCPFVDNTISQGYFGIYVFHMADTASTKCDNIIALDMTGVEEHATKTEAFFSVSPNPFRDKTTITFNGAQNIGPSGIKIYDVTGRLVKDFLFANSITWNGKDAHGNIAAPGVYFIVDDQGNTLDNVIKIR